MSIKRQLRCSANKKKLIFFNTSIFLYRILSSCKRRFWRCCLEFDWLMVSDIDFSNVNDTCFE